MTYQHIVDFGLTTEERERLGVVRQPIEAPPTWSPPDTWDTI